MHSLPFKSAFVTFSSLISVFKGILVSETRSPCFLRLALEGADPESDIDPESENI